MNLRLKTILATGGLVAGLTLASGFSVSTDVRSAEGFGLLGHSLGLTQRDFRTNVSFDDSTASNNTSPHVNFPGQLGAEMAIWKGAVEWSSTSHGNGTGDPVGGNSLGSGGANFDTHWQGQTTSTANFANIVNVLPGFSGTTLAFQIGGGGGWNISYYDGHVWDDGPGTVAGGRYDIQGIMTHEYGHALGLDHTGVGGATMTPSIGAGQEFARSIAGDDIAGVQAIYGASAATKPVITGISGSFGAGQTLTITSTNLSAVNNKVWFTNSAANGSIVKVEFLSSGGGGTTLDVTVPGTAADGDILVQRNQAGGQSLSQPWPFNFDDGVPVPPTPTDISPTSGPNAGWTEVDITGIEFTGSTAVTFGGVAAQSFSVVNDGLIEAVTPPGTNGVSVDVAVTAPDGTGTLVAAYTYGSNPSVDIDMVTPNTGSAAGGTVVSITGPNVVPVFNIKFDGVLATNVQVVSATELTCETPAGTAGATVDVFIQGSGTDTIVDGFTYDSAGGAFVNIGPGLGGALGVPVLGGTGDLTPLGAGGTLTLTNAAASAPDIWFIGLTEAAVPLEGGILYPFPWLLLAVLVTDPSGEISLPLAVPASAAGLDVILQMWIQDATGPNGYTATNGLRLEIP